MVLPGGSLNEDEPTSGRAVRAVGKITIVNTMESFKETNYNEFLNKAGAEIAAAIENGEINQAIRCVCFPRPCAFHLCMLVCSPERSLCIARH